MSPIRHFDHVGITVRDLDTVTAFLAGLGFETEGRTVLEGEFLDTVIGIPNARTEIVMLRPPGGGTAGTVALHPPRPRTGFPRPHAQRTGVAQRDVRGGRPSGDPRPAAADGYHLVGGVGQYEDIWRMASVRGPEGLIVNLAQPIN